MQHKRLFVFDIETIPDTEAAFALTGEQGADVQEQRDILSAYHLEVTDGRNDFLRQPFHKVVVVSFLEAEIERSEGQERYHLKRLSSNKSDDEQEIVEGFFQYLSQTFPRLVSFNGRTFDLPVLKYRAMKYGVSAPFLYKSGDKWNSYTSRYSADWHCDLLDTLSDYGASARIKMNEVCSILGFPGKFGVDGSKVSAMYDAGQLDAIRHYCETDVLNTYLVYLRQQQHTGTLSTEGYNQAIETVLNYIESEQAERQYLQEFKDAWAESCSEKYTLHTE